MSVRDFYAELGIALPGSGQLGNVSTSCFANPEEHNRGDRNPSCGVSLDTGQWLCHACGENGSAFDAAVALGRSRADAVALAKRYDLFPSDHERPYSGNGRGPNLNGAGPKPRDDVDSGTSRDGDKPFRLEVLPARAVCELPDPVTDDQVLGPLVVREQRCVIGAHTGHGKTTFVMQLLSAITEKREFLDWTGAGGRALVIDAEQGLQTVKRRLREAGLDRSENVDYVRVPDGLELNCNTAHIAEVERVIAAGGYSVVFADPLYKLHVGDSNAEREAVDLMRQLDAWRERYRFALILAGHCRKPPVGAKFTMHEFFGSTAYLRGAEVVIGLQRLGDGYSRLHFFKDRDGDLPAIDSRWGLLFDREEGFRRDPSDGKDKPTVKDKIAELLTNSPGMTVAELQSATDSAKRTVQVAVKDLGAASDDRRPAHYSLPDPADAREA